LPWWQAYPGIGANPSAEKFGREIGEKDGQNYTRQRTERQALLFVILRVDSLLGLVDFLSILPAKTIRFQTCQRAVETGQQRAEWTGHTNMRKSTFTFQLQPRKCL
jgi:hypothetical protein